MGITLDKYFENIHSVIFSPKAFFEREDETISVRLGITTIVLITVISKVTVSIFDSTITDHFFILSLLWSVVCAIFLWFITALFFEYIAKIFDKDGNLTKTLYYTSFAPIPYIFFAPLSLIKDVGTLGYFLGTYSQFFLAIWIIFLYALAISSSYKISIARSFMLIFLPFIGSFFASAWTIGFFSKLWYIFSL